MRERLMVRMRAASKRRDEVAATGHDIWCECAECTEAERQRDAAATAYQAAAAMLARAQRCGASFRR